MNINKFTQKSLQAVNDLEKIAYQFGNQEVEQEHLLYALLNQEDSLIKKLIEKMEIQPQYFANSVESAIEKRTKVSGGKPYIGNGRRICLSRASVPCHDSSSKQNSERAVS